MPRFPALDPTTLTGRGQELTAAIQTKAGRVANIYRTMAAAPAALEAQQAMNEALNKGVLRRPVQELLAVFIGELNGCHYCVSAHTVGAAGFKLTEEEILAARRGESADPKTAVILRLARAIFETRGKVPDAVIEAVRAAGLSDAEIIETGANVARNVFTNYFNNLAQTEIDFPLAPPLGQ